MKYLLTATDDDRNTKGTGRREIPSRGSFCRVQYFTKFPSKHAAFDFGPPKCTRVQTTATHFEVRYLDRSTTPSPTDDRSSYRSNIEMSMHREVCACMLRDSYSSQ